MLFASHFGAALTPIKDNDILSKQKYHFPAQYFSRTMLEQVLGEAGKWEKNSDSHCCGSFYTKANGTLALLLSD